MLPKLYENVKRSYLRYVLYIIYRIYVPYHVYLTDNFSLSKIMTSLAFENRFDFSKLTVGNINAQDISELRFLLNASLGESIELRKHLSELLLCSVFQNGTFASIMYVCRDAWKDGFFPSSIEQESMLLRKLAFSACRRKGQSLVVDTYLEMFLEQNPEEFGHLQVVSAMLESGIEPAVICQSVEDLHQYLANNATFSGVHNEL